MSFASATGPGASPSPLTTLSRVRVATTSSADAAAAIPDAVVGLLFVVAFAATSSEARSTLRAGNGVDPEVSA